MSPLLIVLALAHADEPVHYEAPEVLVEARAPVFGIDVPRPPARIAWYGEPEISGDGWTVDLWFVARGSNGGPVKNLDLYVSASVGQLGPIVPHGEGLYSMAYTPPEVNRWTPLTITARGITEDQDGVYIQRDGWLLPELVHEVYTERDERPRRPKRLRPRAPDAPVVAFRD